MYIGQQRMTSLSFLAVVSFTSISWLMAEAIAPRQAHAYTATVNVALSRQMGESYQSFMRRAEAVARAAAQRSFDRDILVSDVAVTIVGQNDGAIVPILSLAVSRQRWRSRPDPQLWAKYFPDTQSLLRFNTTTKEAETPTDATPSTEPSKAPTGTTPGRVIQLPGGVRRISNPGGGTQQNRTPSQGTSRSNATQQNNAPNSNTPQSPAPGQVIQLPGGLRLIPNPGTSP